MLGRKKINLESFLLRPPKKAEEPKTKRYALVEEINGRGDDDVEVECAL